MLNQDTRCYRELIKDTDQKKLGAQPAARRALSCSVANIISMYSALTVGSNVITSK